MDNIEAVQVSYPADNLLEISAGLFLLDLRILYYVVKELAIFNVLHDQKKMAACLYYFVKLDYGRVANQFQDMDLS